MTVLELRAEVMWLRRRERELEARLAVLQRVNETAGRKFAPLAVETIVAHIDAALPAGPESIPRCACSGDLAPQAPLGGRPAEEPKAEDAPPPVGWWRGLRWRR
jgi:hypothetical protein